MNSPASELKFADAGPNIIVIGSKTLCILRFSAQIGFDADKKIVGVKSDVYSDGGWTWQGADALFACYFGQVNVVEVNLRPDLFRSSAPTSNSS